MHQRILLTKEYMNKRLITTVDNKTGRKWRQMLFGDERQHKKFITMYLFSAHQKSCSVGSTWKRSKEEVTYNSPDVKLKAKMILFPQSDFIWYYDECHLLLQYRNMAQISL